MRATFSTSQRHILQYCLKDNNTCAVRTVQKLLINSIADRDYSAQETCHLLLQLPMFHASKDFVILSLDGSRALEQQLSNDRPATALSILDHYSARADTIQFATITLLQFVQQYNMNGKRCR